jgi:hypothetical protein
VTDDVMDELICVHAHRITLQLRCQAGGGAASERLVEGELECEDGSVHTFIGWLGLVNELERVVADAGSAGAA